MIKYCRSLFLFLAFLICGIALSSCSLNLASEKPSANTAEHELTGLSDDLPAEETPEGAPEPTPEEMLDLNIADEPDNPAPEEAEELKVAYITIDDGPSRENTPAILDLLSEEGIKATFFVLPHTDVDDIYQRIIDEGHELANHSYSHVYNDLYNANDIGFFRDDIQKMQDFLLDNFGYEAVSFRFPGGTMGRKKAIIEERAAVLSELGLRYFDWDVSTNDTDTSAEGKKVDVLVSNVVENTRDRDKLIILMHDSANKQPTVEALPIIIEKLREQGYTFDILKNY